MNTLLAGILGGFCGLVQLVMILALETRDADAKSGLLSGDAVFPIFACLVMIEIVSVIALAMYRVSPWILRLVGDPDEANRITSGKRKYGARLFHLTLIATVARRILVMVDFGVFVPSLFLSLGIALAPMILPRPKA